MRVSATHEIHKVLYESQCKQCMSACNFLHHSPGTYLASLLYMQGMLNATALFLKYAHSRLSAVTSRDHIHALQKLYVIYESFAL